LSSSLIATVVAWDDIVVVPWGSAWPKQFLRGTIWLLSHPVITTLVAVWRNLVDVACRNATQKVFDQRIHCNGGYRQTSFIAGAMVIYCNGKGWRFSTMDLFASRLLKVVAQSPIVVRGSSLPCMVYTTLMRLIVAWHDVHSHLPLW
jgi:hypothetical protein